MYMISTHCKYNLGTMRWHQIFAGTKKLKKYRYSTEPPETVWDSFILIAWNRQSLYLKYTKNTTDLNYVKKKRKQK